MKTVVTGGAGFIGSHIVDLLIEKGHRVAVYDNLSTGRKLFFEHHLNNPRFRFLRGDILDFKRLSAGVRGCDAVFHFAANADVKGGIKNTRLDLEQNTLGTHNVLEAMRVHGVKKIVFASSATVYGEPEKIPTAENEPLIQTSLYGASKLAGEALIQAYGEYCGIESWSFRFVSWIGERYTHGVIFDFVKKLLANPKELFILGNGRQKKSYLAVEDGVSGIWKAFQTRSKNPKRVYNLGHTQIMVVRDLADEVCRTMGLNGVRYRYSGGIRGWLGDSPVVHLDTRRVRALGWTPKTGIREGIRATVRYILKNPELLRRKD
ncbi:MAG: hypothetical protein A3G41_02930 [Elusimicrobia bacterium RIFCSPLOWO2_12_FULL_59_9]|nr:MAG: hypothetical protein A3G41_02930 [Elusimicrobia bacterium RIFCSPLOWO2_12_FULL_59_9]